MSSHCILEQVKIYGMNVLKTVSINCDFRSLCHQIRYNEQNKFARSLICLPCHLLVARVSGKHITLLAILFALQSISILLPNSWHVEVANKLLYSPSFLLPFYFHFAADKDKAFELFRFKNAKLIFMLHKLQKGHGGQTYFLSDHIFISFRLLRYTI